MSAHGLTQRPSSSLRSLVERALVPRPPSRCHVVCDWRRTRRCVLPSIRTASRPRPGSPSFCDDVALQLRHSLLQFCSNLECLRPTFFFTRSVSKNAELLQAISESPEPPLTCRGPTSRGNACVIPNKPIKPHQNSTFPRHHRICTLTNPDATCAYHAFSSRVFFADPPLACCRLLLRLARLRVGPCARQGGGYAGRRGGGSY